MYVSLQTLSRQPWNPDFVQFYAFLIQWQMVKHCQDIYLSSLPFTPNFAGTPSKKNKTWKLITWNHINLWQCHISSNSIVCGSVFFPYATVPDSNYINRASIAQSCELFMCPPRTEWPQGCKGITTGWWLNNSWKKQAICPKPGLWQMTELIQRDKCS